MGAFVLVSFVVPVQAGLAFPRTSWPLHVTVVRFDTRDTVEAICARLDQALPSLLGFGVCVGPDAHFGRNGSVPVSLVEPEPALERLHAAALEALGPEVHLPGPGHHHSNYRPHVTHAAERLYPGDRFTISQAALVDLRPENDPRLRRVVAVWEPEQDPRTRHQSR